MYLNPIKENETVYLKHSLRKQGKELVPLKPFFIQILKYFLFPSQFNDAVFFALIFYQCCKLIFNS